MIRRRMFWSTCVSEVGGNREVNRKEAWKEKG